MSKQIQKENKKTASVIILSAPSGGGKTSLAKEILQRNPDIMLSVSVTTRTARKGEIEGVDYFFKTREEFQKMQDSDQFLESAKVYDNYYGTPREYVEKNLSDGKSVLFDIDHQGAKSIKEKLGDQVISIFILPPSIEVLKKRLIKRAQNDEQDIQKRLDLARFAMSYAKEYDHVVVNNDFMQAASEIQQIIDRS